VLYCTQDGRAAAMDLDGRTRRVSEFECPAASAVSPAAGLGLAGSYLVQFPSLDRVRWRCCDPFGWSQDGSTALLSNPDMIADQSQLIAYDVAADRFRTLFTSRYQTTPLGLSPDGRWVVYREFDQLPGTPPSRQPPGELLAISTDGSQTRAFYSIYGTDPLEESVLGWLSDSAFLLQHQDEPCADVPHVLELSLAQLDDGLARHIFDRHSYAALDPKSGTVLLQELPRGPCSGVHEPGPLVLLPVSPGPRAAGARLPMGLDADEPAGPWVAGLVAGDVLLDPEGTSIRRTSGAVFLSGDGGGGLLSRRAELAALEEDSTRLAARRGELDQAVAAAQRAHSEAEATLATAATRLERARVALREAQAGNDDAERQLQRLERERTEVEDALARTRRHLDERARRLREIQTARTAAEQERARLDERLQAQRLGLADLESQQEAARERRVHWQVEEAQVSAREDAARERERRASEGLAQAEATIRRLEAELAEIATETAALAQQRAQWTDQLAERRVQVQQLQAAAQQAEAGVGEAEEALRAAESAVEASRTQVFELREEAHRLELREAETTARRRAMVERVEGEWHKPIDQLLAGAPDVAGDPEALQEEAERLAQAIEALGPVNALAVEEHAEEVKRLEFLTGQRDDLVHARHALLQAVREIDQTARTMFVETFGAIRDHFRSVFEALFEGGECEVRLADESDPLTSDIEIRAAPRGKRTQRIHLLSSGERTLVAISLLFAIYLTKPSPFCLLDEVDAPLDDANVARFVRLLNEFKSQTQFIVITHNPRTMQACDAVYGVTMQEPGVSTIVGVRLGEVEPV